MNLFKYLKKFMIPLIFLIALLGIRAYGELELPSYTSKLVDVGIQQQGIEDAVPEQLSARTYQMLLSFMSAKEQQEVTSHYKQEGDTYVLQPISETERDSLNALFEQVISSYVVMIQSQQIIDPQTMNDTQKISAREQILEQFGPAKAMMMKQTSIAALKQEYQQLNIDLEQKRQDYLMHTGLLMLGVTLISGIASVLTNYISSRVSSTIGRNLRSQLYQKVMSFSKSDLDKFGAASLITRTTNDIQQVQNTLNIVLFIALFSPIMLVGGVYKVLQTTTNMGWIIVVGVLLLFAFIGVLLALAMPKFKIMQDLIDRVNLISREILTGLSVIRVFKREEYEENRFDKANKDLMETQLFVNRTMNFMMPALLLLMNGLSVAIVWIGGQNIDNGSLQVGEMMAFLTYTMQIIMSFVMLTFLSVTLPRASVAANRIDEVLAVTPSIKDKDETVSLTKVQGEVAFHDVSFTFEGASEPVLEHISFEAKPGKTTAIIGSTGSGKSTLIHLIPRFFDATKGMITIDGIDIKNLALHDLREMIGFVPQKGVLFSGTIESNIKFGNETLSDEAMIEAAEIAQATEFISKKEEGYHSPIAQGGNNVSGGQKQRLSIARALAKKPKILLFDDSFSALDFKTDVKLRAALQERMQEATTIIVAQRISTVLHADQIIVMNEGKIVGIGKHDELLANNQTYQEIAKSQLSEEELEQGGQV